MTACHCNQPPRPKHNYMRPFGSKSEQGKTLQLVQRGTDKRIPVELVKQPSGEVLDPAELEELSVKVASESGAGCATIPHTIEDKKLVVEVTAEVTRQLGLGVYTLTATGRIPDPAYADGYHDYEIVVDLCKVTKYGSNETPIRVQANVLEGLKGKDGKSAYEIFVENGYQGSLQKWMEDIMPKGGAGGGSGTAGPKGDKGEAGPAGPAGPVGPQGPIVLLVLSDQREKRESVALLVSVVSVEKEENKVQLVSKAKRGMLASEDPLVRRAKTGLRAIRARLVRKGREALLVREVQLESVVLSVLLVPLDLLAQRATRAMTPIKSTCKRQMTIRSFQGSSGRTQSAHSQL